jgi:alpha,alpha-trehalase
VRSHSAEGPLRAVDHSNLARGTAPPKVLRDYAFVADGIRGALIDSEGTLAWMCFPGWADPAVFPALLGARGAYSLTPEGRHVAGGFYEAGTLIWHSRWVTENGVIDSREALAYPGDTTRAVVLRRVTARDQPGRVRVSLELAADYGRRPVGGWNREGDRWISADDVVTARWTGAGDAVLEQGEGGGQRLVLRLGLEAGEVRDLVLEIMEGSAGGVVPAEADDCWVRTEKAWRAAVPACTDSVARTDVRRSFAVLRGMTVPEGATVAAATTSLPEHDEAGRNYDYRYAWVRDTCYVGHAGAAIAGGEPVLDDAVRWVTARLLSDGVETVPAYLPDGSPIPEQASLGLPGYPGGFDVVGNRARQQFQLDVFGEALLLLANAAARDRLDSEGWRAAELALSAIEKSWARPDAGIWETEPALWTHSRLICVAGLLAMSKAGAPSSWVRNALPLADHLLSETDRTSLHPTGRWQRSPRDERVDASLLLMEIRGALPAEDPRSRATRKAIVADLAQAGYLYRYRQSGQALGEAEGAFLICNFWMALACARSGEMASAARWFERARAACGSPGLFAEEFDVEQRQLRGNLPQAFVHALLIESAGGQEWDGDAGDG